MIRPQAELPCQLPTVERSYWSLAAEPERTVTSPLPDRADACIIGGGYTGAAAGLGLARNSARVVILDRGELGSGASSRNGGMVLPGLALETTELSRRLGLARARELFQASLTAVQELERLVAQEGIDCSLTRCGHLTTASRPSHLKDLRREQAFLARELGYDTRVLEPDQMAAELGSGTVWGGLIDPEASAVHPTALLSGLVEGARSAGASLQPWTEALEVTRRQGGFEIRTSRGTCRAEVVIAATNGYTPDHLAWLRRRVVPLDSLLIATSRLPQDLTHSLLPTGRTVSNTRRLLHYFRLSPDHSRLLFGGRLRSARKGLQANAALLRQEMLTVFPQLAPYDLEFAWTGRVGFTLDLLPHAGCRDGLYYALGYSGHGVALATHLGARLADRVLGRAGDSAFDSPGFAPVHLQGLVRPLLLTAYGLLDRVN